MPCCVYSDKCSDASPIVCRHCPDMDDIGEGDDPDFISFEASDDDEKWRESYYEERECHDEDVFWEENPINLINPKNDYERPCITKIPDGEGGWILKPEK